ncbi:MAG TPA: iron-siderophore ABC transporter substrate-binding protein [Vicinamibacteria bacterium]|nr:iron-siderophore ABC transporter substrate-binding protein [Vicinamibacteria bacterium]
MTRAGLVVASTLAFAAWGWANDGGRVVGHARGETRVPARPARVVVLTNEATEAALALGVRPVAAVRSWSRAGWHPHLAALMEGVPVVGDEYAPDEQAIARLEPDLILGNDLRQAARFNALSAIAPTVFSKRLHGRWKENLRLYAHAMGRAAAAEERIGDWERRVAEARRRLPHAERTRVAVVRFMPRATRIYYADSFPGTILAALGFARAPAPPPPDDFVQDLTPDRVGELASADVLFHMTFEMGEGDARAREKAWTSLPGWRTLPAVRSGHAFEVDDGVFNTSGGILAARLALDEIVRLLGPSRRGRAARP